jgi:hypothetical protein
LEGWGKFNTIPIFKLLYLRLAMPSYADLKMKNETMTLLGFVTDEQ